MSAALLAVEIGIAVGNASILALLIYRQRRVVRATQSLLRAAEVALADREAHLARIHRLDEIDRRLAAIEAHRTAAH